MRAIGGAARRATPPAQIAIRATGSLAAKCGGKEIVKRVAGPQWAGQVEITAVTDEMSRVVQGRMPT